MAFIRKKNRYLHQRQGEAAEEGKSEFEPANEAAVYAASQSTQVSP